MFVYLCVCLCVRSFVRSFACFFLSFFLRSFVRSFACLFRFHSVARTTLFLPLSVFLAQIDNKNNLKTIPAFKAKIEKKKSLSPPTSRLESALSLKRHFISSHLDSVGYINRNRSRRNHRHRHYLHHHRDEQVSITPTSHPLTDRLLSENNSLFLTLSQPARFIQSDCLLRGNLKLLL